MSSRNRPDCFNNRRTSVDTAISRSRDFTDCTRGEMGRRLYSFTAMAENLFFISFNDEPNSGHTGVDS